MAMSIRQRIALATSVVVLISLLGLSAGVYITTSRSLRNEVDARLVRVYTTYRQDQRVQVTDQGVAILSAPDPFASAGQYIQILDVSGAERAKSNNMGEESLPISETALANALERKSTYYDTNVNGRELRVFTSSVFSVNGVPLIVQVAEVLGPMNETLAELRRNLLGGTALTTILLSLAAWLVTDTAMRPVRRMSDTAATIGGTTDLSQRLSPPRTGDDVQLLAESFNDMLARLEATFNAERRFVADASHELRTPLTALRANADIMLRQITSGMVDHDDLAEGLTDIRDEADRMTRLVSNLLTLARADVGWRPELEPVSLLEVAQDVARIAQPLVRGQRFEVRTVPLTDGESLADATQVLGNADQLTQLLLILLDNAFTHAPPDSEVVLEIAPQPTQVVVTVRDTGPGIAPEHIRRIFERFFRTDDARTRSSGGAGLGLSIARWIVSVHRGDISVQSELGQGTTFTVNLQRLLGDPQQTLPLPRQALTPPASTTSASASAPGDD